MRRASRRGSFEDAANGRRPPAPATVCRRDSPIVEVSRDLTEAPSGLTLSANMVDDVGREDLRSSLSCRRCGCASGSSPFRDESLELIDGDESRSPRHLDRLDQRQDSVVERRAAHSQRRGRLRAGVGEALYTRRLSNDFYGCSCRIGSRVAPGFLASTSQAAARHSYSVHK
jgi:hypothetical protein